LAVLDQVGSKIPIITAKLFGTILFKAFELCEIGPPPNPVPKKCEDIQTTLNL
jgi:hypothetical protein